APKHTADEEQSLFPRLRAIDRPDLHEIIERVAALEKDHTEAEADHAEVDRLGREWLSADRLAENDALRLVQLLAKLSGHYQSHIAIEEREVFPAAAAALSKSQREAVGAEMAARRGLPPAP
ncbi:MAG TPA: hemerythrin domain-containing protein, partial [Burkholderiales bacterium]|nr:hemerythrin domain-containing protein [Burkholderiales bacterium]